MFQCTKGASLAIATACALAVSSAASAAIVYQAEFNTNGNAEGWAGTTATPNISGLGVAGGTLNGTATNGDPRLGITGLSVGLTPPNTAWESIVFRVREKDSGGTPVTTFSSTGLVIQVNGVTVAASFSGAASGDDFLTVTGDISSLSSSTIINSMRLDPIGGGASNSTFEVDYIRVTAIPEPASLGLLGLGGLFMGRRRGR